MKIQKRPQPGSRTRDDRATPAPALKYLPGADWRPVNSQQHDMKPQAAQYLFWQAAQYLFWRGRQHQWVICICRIFRLVCMSLFGAGMPNSGERLGFNLSYKKCASQKYKGGGAPDGSQVGWVRLIQNTAPHPLLPLPWRPLEVQNDWKCCTPQVYDTW